MENLRDDIDELIGKYLAGEASVEEGERVNQWANASEENRRHFSHYQTIFEKAATVQTTQVFDEDAAWEKLKSKLAGKEGRTISMRRDTAWSPFWRVAATILLVAGVGFFAYKLSQGPTGPLNVTAKKETVSDTLPDGSNVFLNKETTLTYAYDKKKKEHRVKLSGEAYFSINHDDNKTFIIDIGGIYIKDIGTSFNVKAYPDSATIEVVVVEGAVMFYTENDSGNYLRANGKGVYNKKTKQFSLEQPETNALSYKTRFFVFSNTDLGSVADELNKVYDKKTIVPDHLKNCRLTVTFNNESLDEITDIIADTMGLTKKETTNGITLEGTCVK